MGAFSGGERCCIVAAYFPTAGALRSHAVVLAHNTDVGILEAAFEVRSYRSNHHQEHIFVGFLYTDTGGKTDFYGTDVKRCSATVGGDEAFIELYGLDAHFFKELNGNRLHQKTFCRLADTLGVLLDAEYTDFAVFAAKSLEPLEHFLTIVKACSRHVDVYGIGL